MERLTFNALLQVLQSYPFCEKYWLAYSGGMDSSVLLHLFFTSVDQINVPIEVVYVDHGLTANSHHWGNFCKQQCQDYGFDFTQIEITEPCPKSRSVEEWARVKRYQLIADKMAESDLLFTAHHQDDQVETFFLQALRGSGARGLACMPTIKKFIRGFHARPLLKIPRTELQHYAHQHDLKWCIDESNADWRYSRNYIRQHVLPQIQMRYPAYRHTVTRLISHQQEYRLLLDELAQQDLAAALQLENMSLQIDVVQTYSIVRQKNLVMAWLAVQQLAMPNSKNLERMMTQLIAAETTKSLAVNWADVTVKRYKNKLYAFKLFKEHDVNTKYDWTLVEPIKILGETLSAIATVGAGLSKKKIENKKIIVCHRVGGEKIYLKYQSHSKTVKQLFQERQVLPWYRNRVPLLYIDDVLIAIPGFCVDKRFCAKGSEPSWQIVWSGYGQAIQQK